MAAPLSLPMYFQTLEIKNFKCFGTRQQLDLTGPDGHIAPWTMILGDNGVGKTSLLKCFVWMTPVEETDEKKKEDAGITQVAIKPMMDDFESEVEYERLIRKGATQPLEVGAILSNGVELRHPVPDAQKVSHSLEISMQDNGELSDIKASYSELQEFNSVNLFAYSAGRHMGVNNFEQLGLKSPIANLFSDTADLYDAEQVMANLYFSSLSENNQGKNTELLDKVKQVLIDLLPDIESKDSFIINPPFGPDGSPNASIVEVRTPFGKVPFRELSLGYQTMTAWVLDLALHMLWRNPEAEYPLMQPAVVLIDEIDLHLHPRWQRTIREYLLSHFPKTQFICTAHSPFMAQSSETENLCVLRRENDEVLIENNPLVVRGWRIGQIVTSDLFSLDERSHAVEVLVKERQSLLDKAALNAADEQRLSQLDSTIGKLPTTGSTVDDALLERIKEAAELLHQRGNLP